MKNNKNTNLNRIYILITVFLILGISFVSAFAVGGPYMPNKELILSQNSGTTDLQFTLQNGGGATEAISVKASILGGSEIAALTDENDVYTVAPGDIVPVNLRITIPSNATVGKTYNVRLEFITATAGQGGQFGIGTGEEQSFTVVVGEKIIPEKQGNGALLYIIIGILLVLVIMVLVLIKRKNRK
jgi:uncharacterized membrane protein